MASAYRAPIMPANQSEIPRINQLIKYLYATAGRKEHMKRKKFHLLQRGFFSFCALFTFWYVLLILLLSDLHYHHNLPFYSTHNIPIHMHIFVGYRWNHEKKSSFFRQERRKTSTVCTRTTENVCFHSPDLKINRFLLYGLYFMSSTESECFLKKF